MTYLRSHVKRYGLNVLLAAASSLCVLSQNASADDFRFNEGVRQFNQGHYKEASELFARHYDENPNGNSAYYLAVCQDKLGDSKTAELYYKKVCEQFPQSEAASLAMQALQAKATLSPSAAALSKPADLDSLPEQATTRFNYGAYASGPAKYKRMMIDCRIDGRAVAMELDTGAEGCVISQAQLARLGITNIPPDAKRMRVMGFGGASYAWTFPAVISVGELTRRVPLVVLPDSNVPSLLGYSFLHGFDYMVDSATNHVTFFKQHSFGPHRTAADPYSVPFRMRGGGMMVPVQINGNTQELLWDTGADSMTITMDVLRRFGIQLPANARRSAIRGVGGVETAFLITVPQITVGSLVRQNVPVTVIYAGQSVLGQSFLQNVRYTVDLSNQRMLFPRPSGHK